MWAILIVLLLAGCIGQNVDNGQGGIASTPQEYNLRVVDEKVDVFVENVEEVNESPSIEIPPEEISSYILNESANLRVLLFSLDSEEEGRLDLISKGDFDVAIVSVPEEAVEDARSKLQSFADDVELFIIPSAKNALPSYEVSKGIYTAKLLIPDYESESLREIEKAAKNRSIEVMNISAGQTIEEQGITFRFVSPFPRELEGDNNNAIAFYIEDRDFRMFFPNDIVEGAIGKIVANGYAYPSNVTVVPNYGRRLGQGTSSYTNILFDKLNVDYAIIEGKPLDLELVEIQEDERDFVARYFLLKGVDVFPVGNYNRVRVAYTQSGVVVEGIENG